MEIFGSVGKTINIARWMNQAILAFFRFYH